uniref:Type I polyketide synthase n=1 Tax=Gambierdiscus excentricus TaxID=986170 RepID=A0A1S6K8L5_9DINO|nr:type I polyketide synthase [Gambierdiscus excentricus]
MTPWPPSTRGGLQVDVRAPVGREPVVEEDHFRECGWRVAHFLQTKGFCVVDMGMDELLQEAVTECADMDEVGRFFAPAAEVVDGLLGEEGSTRIAELGEYITKTKGTALAIFDKKMQCIEHGLALVAPHHFPFTLASRTGGLVHESGTPREVFPYVTQVSAFQWFQIFTCHRVMVLMFLGPEGGTLEIQPFDEENHPHELDTDAGLCVFLRADLFSHKFRAPEETFTLTHWMLETPGVGQRQGRHSCRFPLPPVARTLDRILNQPMQEALLGEAIPRHIHRLLHHRHKTGGQTAVRSAECKMPSVDFTFLLPSAASGIDAVVPIPLTRWDNDLYYDEDRESVKFGKVPCMHGAFIEGVELFDNKHFRISPIEAPTLAPEQRHTLEVGYEVMFAAGFERKTMEKTATGVYVGATWNEWNFVRPMDSAQQLKFGATSGMNAIPANRLSYILGFTGASLSLDSEGASSLMAVCKGNDDVNLPKQRRTTSQALCLGVSLLLSPKVLMDYAPSLSSRCLAFDMSADGYVFGDACAGVLLAPLAEVLAEQSYHDEDHPVRGLIASTSMGNLGSPKSVVDQRLIRTAIEHAGLSPLDIDQMECHGDGTLLADAAEVNSVAKVMRGSSADRNMETLVLGALKPNWAHSRAATGICALLKVLVTQSFGAALPLLHLRQINPHIMEATKRVLFADESAEFWTQSAYVGVMARGILGTLAHVLTWGDMQSSAQLMERDTVSPLQREICWWPGGGGELGDDEYPDNAYTIHGSWSRFEPEEMEFEEPGIYQYTVTMGEHCLEHFQIRLDGDASRVLHPRDSQGLPNSVVEGPSSENIAGGLCWLIDGRPQRLEGIEDSDRGEGDPYEGVAEQGPELAPPRFSEEQGPGDQYCIRLSIMGRWKNVDWERLPVERDEAAPPYCLPITARYWVIADWNCWQPKQEMLPHPRIRGLFTLEVHLRRMRSEFQIVVNRDLDQVLIPSPDGVFGSTVHDLQGPEIAANTRQPGMAWCIEGVPGDFFRIEFQMALEGDRVRKVVTFRRVRFEKLSPAQQRAGAETRYFLTGSWGRWWHTQEMVWKDDDKEGGWFQSTVTLGRDGCEHFQILEDNDRRFVLHPPKPASEASKVVGPDGPEQCDGVNWIIGGVGEDAGRPGSRYTVRLIVSNGFPIGVDWQRIS